MPRRNCECCSDTATQRCERCEKHVCWREFCGIPHQKQTCKRVIRHYVPLPGYPITMCGLMTMRNVPPTLKTTRRKHQVKCKRCVAGIAKEARRA